jgi:chromate transport protein ChrA
MNIKRAIVFSIMLYLLSFLIFSLTTLPFGVDLESYNVSLKSYIFFWLLYIPITLLLAKWYFKQVAPSANGGLKLGIVAILIAFLLDGFSYAVTLAVGENTDMFIAMYSDWKFYFSIIWIIILCIFAGWEFDRTYTKKENKK